jgi:hypothetical protein
MSRENQFDVIIIGTGAGANGSSSLSVETMSLAKRRIGIRKL